MIYNILVFLDASPLTLLTGAMEDAFDSGWGEFFEHSLKNFVGYLVGDDDRIRQLTSSVARKLMTEGASLAWEQVQGADSHTFKTSFWKAT